MLLEVPVIPEVPAVPPVPGLWVISSDGLLTIRTGYDHGHKNEVHLDYDQALKVYEAMGEALANKLYLPTPEGQEPGFWETQPGYDAGTEVFRKLKAELAR